MEVDTAAYDVDEPDGGRAKFFPLLRRSVVNEIRAPELLPYQGPVVEYFLSQIKMIEETMYDVQSVEEKEIADLHLISAKHCKYYLQCYYRARLAKIDKYYMHLLRTEDQNPKLSPAELEYARGYKELMENHLKATVLNELPERVQSLDETSADANMIPEPKVNTHVFCRSLSEVGTIVVDDETGTTLDLHKNSVALVPYKRIRPFVLSGDVELI